jgi:hypothetical protein
LLPASSVSLFSWTLDILCFSAHCVDALLVSFAYLISDRQLPRLLSLSASDIPSGRLRVRWLVTS